MSNAMLLGAARAAMRCYSAGLRVSAGSASHGVAQAQGHAGARGAVGPTGRWAPGVARGFSADSAPPSGGEGGKEGESRGVWRNWIDAKLTEIEVEKGGAGDTGAAAVGTEVAGGGAFSAPPLPDAPMGAAAGGEAAPEAASPRMAPAFQFPKPTVPEEKPDRVVGYAKLGSPIEKMGSWASKIDDAISAEGEEAEEAPATPPEDEEVPDLPPRINPYRLFYPGQTYAPEELDPFTKGGSTMMPSMSTRSNKPFMSDEVAGAINWKDTALLTHFVTETGKCIPRRYTKLRQKTQKSVMKKIKLARSMALMPYMSKLPQYVRRKNPYTST